ncbi:hypothetical protein [Amycolatopsis saalfeldensis]|uniref:PknH-like extracellular domain-containing protein n=1 Tax=Amycolatopsis saalfeldensis TaxID=394193 RepID=A0A1H8SPR8_9PSEU|nr:hypothetical protein [Amycolatopsis saalfeldensis]SEO80328.1 hypothetical protein SAMN04489732_102212 [Amycolatopsis saalfeldensis]
MRHRQVLAVAAVAFVGLAGCGNRPNNLETYYDDPAPVSDTPSATAAPRPPAVPVVPKPDPPKAAVAAVPGALLSDEDVAEEGVHPGAGKVSGCLTGLAPGEQRSASWVYPSGSVLDHQVTAYPDRSGADVVSGADCAGTVLSLPAQEGVTGLRAWCEGSTCTVLVAKGNLVSALSVAASTPTRAADVAKRLLPKLVAKLVAQR